MLKKPLSCIFIFFLFITGVVSQCYNRNTAFRAGEKIDYDVYYNLGFIWIQAADASFQINKGKYNGKSVLHYKSYGKSLSSYDWIYKVRDYFEAYANDSTGMPYKYTRNTYEGGYAVNNTFIFDYEKNKIYSFTENSKRPYKEDTLDLPPCTFDMQSSVYYCRNIDFSKCKPGDKVPVSMIIDNEMIELYIRYLGKDTVETKDGTKFKCLVFTALMMEGSIFSGGEDLKVWVTDDKNKIPVKVEAKILVGSVIAYLSNYSGLRHPITSKLKEEEVPEGKE